MAFIECIKFSYGFFGPKNESNGFLIEAKRFETAKIRHLIAEYSFEVKWQEEKTKRILFFSFSHRHGCSIPSRFFKIGYLRILQSNFLHLKN